jgi:outer membrane protein assembly factor BamB
MWRLERIVLVAVTGLAVAACNSPNAPGAAPTPTATNPQTTPTPAKPSIPDPALAFDRDGVALGEPADGQFAVHEDTAFYLRDDSSATDIPSLVAADLTAGRPRWSKPIATDSMTDRWGPLRVAMLDGKPRLFISYLARLKGTGTQGDRELLRVIALEASDGTRVWTTDLDDDRMPAGPSTRFSTFSPPSIVAATNDHVVLAIDNSAIVLDAKTGTQRWGAADFQPAALDGSTVVGTAITPTGRKVSGRAAADGKEVWSNADPFDRIDPLGAGLVTVTGSASTRLLEAKSGAVKATVAAHHTCAHDTDALIVCWNFTQHIAALNAADGKLLWELPDKSADRIMPRVTSVRRGLIYATAGGNGPVILDARTGKDKVTSVAIAPSLVVPGYGLLLSARGGLFAHRATG